MTRAQGRAVATAATPDDGHAHVEANFATGVPPNMRTVCTRCGTPMAASYPDPATRARAGAGTNIRRQS